jgi:hypothetical protein
MEGASPPDERLVAAVQANCHIADARHARSMTLCTYLLEMRELYRWERGIAFGLPLARADVGAWLAAREALWEREYEGATGFLPLPLAGGSVDPFDEAAVNPALQPSGLVYGAGIGRFGKPQFFLAELEREELRDGVRVQVAGREYARDLAPAAATARGGTVTVRIETLTRLLWEKAEAWEVRRPDGALKAALDAYGFAADARSALGRMAAAETETLILHELGEVRAGQLLGPSWEAMLAGIDDRRAELVARAARDHLADSLVTLPVLLDRGAPGPLHFWFANLDGMRRELFPRAATAYEAWRGGDGGRALRAAAQAGVAHWEGVCTRLLALHARRDAGAVAAAPAPASLALA